MYISDMSRKYAANRIRELRKAKGMTMEQLAASIEPEITTATVQKLETGQMGLTLDYINEFAKVLDVSPFDIIAPAPMRMAPVLGTIAAGNWSDAVELSDEFVPIPADAGGPRTFVLRPQGTSMDLLVSDGGYIAIDPDDIDLVSKRSYAVMNGSGETTFKKFMLEPPRLEPCSTDPRHKSIPVGREPFTIIGRVTFAMSPI